MARIDPKCRDCKTSMTEGFVLDIGHHSTRAASKWVEGPPEKSFWRGLSLEDRPVYGVVAYRCPSCGRLEQYATEAQSK